MCIGAPGWPPTPKHRRIYGAVVRGLEDLYPRLDQGDVDADPQTRRVRSIDAGEVISDAEICAACCPHAERPRAPTGG
jgi:hypothetical protein